MSQSIAASSLSIPVEPLTQSSFASFGTVVDTSKSAPLRDSSAITATLKSSKANQGTATKYANVTPLTNFYDRSRSKTPSRPIASLFICQPRQLDPAPTSTSVDKLFRVEILERHPFTSQTFIPIGTSPNSPNVVNYLVIVAPTLPPSIYTKAREALSPYPTEKPKPTRARRIREMFSSARPEPFTNSTAPSDVTAANAEIHAVHRKPASAGPPDLKNMKAFVARGDQTVTYAAGVWHAPMVVVGESEIPFMVVQHMNGISDEDCQEITLVAKGQDGVTVVVDRQSTDQSHVRAKL